MGRPNQPIFFDCSVLVADRISGVGHVLLATLRAWSNEAPVSDRTILLVPFDRKRQLQSLQLNFAIRTLPIPYKVYRLLKKYDLLGGFDLLLGSGTYIFPDFSNWRLLFGRSITYVHDIYFIDHPEAIAPKNRVFLERYFLRWLKRSNRIVAVSDFTKNELERRKLVPANAISVVHNGVDLSTSATTINLEKYNLPRNYILFVGNFEPRKNVGRLVNAYGLLPQAIRDKYSLVLIGADSWNADDLQSSIKKAQQNGRNIVRIEKSVSDDELRAIYKQASVLALPSLYEGFGMTPLEAMVQGVPVVVSNNSALPEVVGDAGLYVDAENEADISAKITVVLRDAHLREQLCERGYEQARRYTWERSVRELLACIEKVKGMKHE